MTNSDTAARVLMGDSLSFHIIFVLFSLTLPVLVCWFEWLAIRRKDDRYRQTAYFWSKIMAVLIIAGVISGTVVAIQMSVVWPGILKFGGKVIGLPFLFETYAFLIEAVFLALYMYTWRSKRVPQYLHWVFGIFVFIGATMSAYAITSVNAWMNLPTGFTIVHGHLANIQVFHAMFSTTALIEFFHSMPAYYLAASLVIAGLYGFKLARVKRSERITKHRFEWNIIHKLLIFASIAVVFSAITGDLTGKYLAHYEPSKLATLEIVNKTETHAPFIFGGFEKNGKLAGPYFKIPDALSILVGETPSTKVKGLNIIPVSQRPPAFIHVLFNVKLAIIALLVISLVLYFIVRAKKPKLLASRSVLITCGIFSFVGIVLVELGWMLTEIGRQPWAVRGYVTTAQAVTTHNISSFGYIFPSAFVVLFIVTILAVRRILQDQNKPITKKRTEY